MPEKSGDKDLSRFTEPAFIEKLWNHLIGRLGFQPETIPERHKQPRSVNPLVRAAVIISMWARFRPVFERVVWLRDIIGVDLRGWHHLRRLAEASADQIILKLGANHSGSRTSRVAADRKEILILSR
jgi:hypothetical protein